MTIQQSPSVSPIRSRWVAHDLYQLMNEVIALRERAKALEAEAADRTAPLSSVESKAR
ncbi:hypothetical protein [Bradyrhizobium sp. McL0615]|jgi:hypothetical protein|uniref:hypothetical protein n=1 Tax=Bradyrhizobium sp. McL0615 TaxID=3415673 RepID=UPI003CF20F71